MFKFVCLLFIQALLWHCIINISGTFNNLVMHLCCMNNNIFLLFSNFLNVQFHTVHILTLLQLKTNYINIFRQFQIFKLSSQVLLIFNFNYFFNSMFIGIITHYNKHVYAALLFMILNVFNQALASFFLLINLHYYIGLCLT
jgi:hypothetical protein